MLQSYRHGAIMSDMGTFRIDFAVASQATRDVRLPVAGALVDTGSEASWIPSAILESLGVPRLRRSLYRQASGNVIERWTGPVVIFAAGTFASDDVVFAEPGDLTLLGARTLEGLNVTIDRVSKRLVDAGPAPAAVLQKGIRSSLPRGIAAAPTEAIPQSGGRCEY